MMSFPFNQFVDRATIVVKGGRGGNGCISYEVMRFENIKEQLSILSIWFVVPDVRVQVEDRVVKEEMSISSPTPRLTH